MGPSREDPQEMRSLGAGRAVCTSSALQKAWGWGREAVSRDTGVGAGGGASRCGGGGAPPEGVGPEGVSGAAGTWGGLSAAWVGQAGARGGQALALLGQPVRA